MTDDLNKVFTQAEVEQIVGDKVAALLKDRDVIEVDLAAKVAERLAGWAKLFGWFVAGPVALIFLIFGVLGISKYEDIKAAAVEIEAKKQEAVKEFDTAVKGAKDVVATAKKASDDANDVVASAKKEVDQAVSQAKALVSAASAEYKAASQSLNELTNKVDQTKTELGTLSNKVNSIAETGLTPEQRNTLERIVRPFILFLEHDVGFTKVDQIANVSIVEEPGAQILSTFDTRSGGRIRLGNEEINDPYAILVSYAKWRLSLGADADDKVVWPSFEQMIDADQVLSAIAIYYAASFANTQVPPPVNRRLPRSYTDLSNDLSGEVTESYWKSDLAPSLPRGLVLSHMLWEIRQAIGDHETDRTILKAWDKINSDAPSPTNLADRSPTLNFLDTLLAEAFAGGDMAEIRQVLQRYKVVGI